MKIKIFLPIGALVLATGLFSCQNNTTPATDGAAAAPEALQAPYTQQYYDSLGQVMAAYHGLSAALVKSDTTAATSAAILLKQHVDSLPVQLLQMDSARLAAITGITGSISAELNGLVGEQALEGKREEYQMVSDMLYDLIKATGYKGHTVYRQFCPMAFDDKGAYWLSETRNIVNPYFGDKMLECGSTNDSLIYK
ncbi:Protein of unknown function [Chitinophaga jiangningensis]|uniref:DUF3347 domain-containing protein n=1 Tax=Chitinophaga jiangningensis TaxID=1419482 RepID=A0A1M7MRR0_9BACT|nr:DUF3347 domain-containing protein [Chitinophaga jiangningensis]SHM93781.1 Protein of unknown function [Chitinophaga jiangningensis]